MNFTIDFKPNAPTKFKIEKNNFIFNALPLKIKNIPDQNQIIVDSLNHPIGTNRIENMLKPEMDLVILVDDITRPTPSSKILPHLIERIKATGISDTHIKIIIAPGTHRPMTEKELEIKLGRQILNRYIVLNRDYRETSKFEYLGKTKSGIPIDVDSEVYNADFVIGIGTISPHISAGWSGGAKIILPGICSARTTDMMHYTACIAQPVLEILGSNDNIPRKEMEEIAEKVGLNFIINTVLDEKDNILGIFSGHYIHAHQKGTELAEKLFCVPIPQKADILIVSANPCHFDYWQGIKPYAYSHRAIRKGGVLIFLLDGEEHLCGDAPSHEFTLKKYMLWDFEAMKKEVERGRATDIVGMNVPMYHATLRHRTTNFIVTNHLKKDEIDILGFEYKKNVQVALDHAFKLLGKDAKVGIIPFGGKTLTKVNLEDFKKIEKNC
ncbi:MAG: hypothetical protein A2163_03215 [Actinobacteria bacterium RBG_13_35_12]|nr:MAG: hypothetical protein A2163_03215 [Actinobacteria bacterium RBG_13_35_12]